MSPIRPTRCLSHVIVTLILGVFASVAVSQETETLAVRSFEIGFDVVDARADDTVTLWYTHDDGNTWAKWKTVAAEAGGISFDAAHDGSYGFRLAINGSNGVEPLETFWTWVDGEPPVLQLHPLNLEHGAGIQPVVLVRWTAVDAGLARRPVSLAYRVGVKGQWHGIEDGVANTGSYDWRLPEGVSGDVAIRVRCVDRAGHAASAVGTSSVPSRNVEDIESFGSLPRNVKAFVGQDLPQERGVREADRERADKLFDKAQQHVARTEYRLAASRLRDVLAIDPQRVDALVTLGGVLYAQGLKDEALESYGLALSQRPNSYEALEGSALVHLGEKRFGAAVQQLSQIVRNDPNHAQTWLHLGDVAIYQGDEILAREHYKRVLGIPTASSELTTQARSRLQNLRRLATDFRQTDR